MKRAHTKAKLATTLISVVLVLSCQNSREVGDSQLIGAGVSSQAVTAVASAPLSIATNSLDDASSGMAYAATLVAKGGDSPVTWQLISGQLPDGVSLSPSGNIGGIPAAAGQYKFTVQGTDSASPPSSVTTSLSLTVNPSNLAVSVPMTKNPDIKLSVIQYNQGWIPKNYDPAIAAWLANHFDFIIGSSINMYPYDEDTTVAEYSDSEGLYVNQFYNMVYDIAAQHRWNYENVMLHFNTDYQVPPNTQWLGLDQFDIFEGNGMDVFAGVGSPVWAVNGAFVYDGTHYYDVTRTLYAGTCGATCTIRDELYLGYAEPFALIKMTLSSPRVAGSAKWQYFNGSTWQNLALTSDSTNGITASGSITFLPPSNWQRTIVNGSRSKYWVRLVVTGAASGPVLATVKGDDWLAHDGSNNMRGWCESCAHVNGGLGNLEYDPNPPAGQSAHFRYQARASGYWNHNYIEANIADVQGGILTFPELVKARWILAYEIDGQKLYSGVAFDNVYGHISPISPKWSENLTDLPCSPNCTAVSWSTYIESQMKALTAMMRTIPDADLRKKFTVAINGGGAGINLQDVIDLNGFEFAANVTSSDSATEYQDPYLPANNPNGTIGDLAIWDNQHFGLRVTRGTTTTTHIWDNGNRTPILALALYYLGANTNTMFEYNTLGWSYYDTDEFYYWSPDTSTLSEALAFDTSSTAQKTLHITNGSRFTPPGAPLYTRSSQYVIQIGGADVVQATKVNDTTFVTTTPIAESYPANTVVRFALVGHQAWQQPPSSSDIWYYANFIPASEVDLGVPNTAGWNSGNRDLAYALGPNISGQPAACAPYPCAPLMRRDFTNAVVLVRPFGYATGASELDVYSKAINLVDPAHKLAGPYYRLNADGTTAPAINSLELRGGEAAILLKHAIP